MQFTLPALPYDKKALGFISENTLNFHHGKHFQTYIDTTNKLVTGSNYENMSLEEIVLKAQGPLFNNAAQAWNHDFYFKCISPVEQTVPAKLLALIEKNFDNLESFIDKFTASATANFGAGWTWLIQVNNTLKIMNTTGAGNPMVDGFNPLLTVDVWEHAYYLDYQNRRADYLKEFAKHINWDFVNSNLK